MIRAFIILVICSVHAIVASAQNAHAPVLPDVVRLPDKSFIYPDTFAVYWTVDQHEETRDSVTIKVKYATMFDDVIDETEFVEDSIISFLFGEDHASAHTHMLQWQTVAGLRSPGYTTRKTKLLNVRSCDSENDALRALVQNTFRWQNLELLADAYEKKECFVNAYYVYFQLLNMDPERGKRSFNDFLLRNKSGFQTRDVAR